MNQALTLSYGREILADKLFYGISLKTIQVKRKGSPREWGGGVDLGLLYYPTKKLRLGIREGLSIAKTGSLKKSIPETVTWI